jgi:hypothetical protein
MSGTQTEIWREIIGLDDETTRERARLMAEWQGGMVARLGQAGLGDLAAGWARAAASYALHVLGRE